MKIESIPRYYNSTKSLAFNANKKSKPQVNVKSSVNKIKQPVPALERHNAIKFAENLTLTQAFFRLAKSNIPVIKNIMSYKQLTPNKLYETAVDIESDKFLRNIDVNGILDIGAFAFTFETNDTKVIKITKGNHFPNSRKPDSFDLPILKKGKIGSDMYYYLEEKVNQNNISDKEIIALIKKIEAKGYKVQDYLIPNTKADNEFGKAIKRRQFGRTNDGTLYLIDPGLSLIHI